MQQLSDTPSLGETAPGREGWIAAEDLADTAQAVVGEVVLKQQQESPRCMPFQVDPQVS